MEYNYIDIDLQKRNKEAHKRHISCFTKIDFRIDHITITMSYEVGSYRYC